MFRFMVCALSLLMVCACVPTLAARQVSTLASESGSSKGAMMATSTEKPKRFNEYVIPKGHKKRDDYTLPMPRDYVEKGSLPKSFSWANVNGQSLVTKSLNQHIPQCTFHTPCLRNEPTRISDKKCLISTHNKYGQNRLRKLLGARRGVRARGPHQDCTQGCQH